MPAHKKPTPEKYCEVCGKKLERKMLPNGDLEYLIHFNRRKYCDRLCFSNRVIPHSEDPCWATAHYHSRRACPPASCAVCGAEKRTDVHHKDGNWQNNKPANLERLCRSCHMKSHKATK